MGNSKSSHNHNIYLLPVGWGSFIVHDYQSDFIITDGGCMRQCFGESKHILRYVMSILSRNLRWTWILSHFEADHFSIIVTLIKYGLLSKPERVILPAVYSIDICREAIADLLKCALIIERILKIPLYVHRKLLEILSDPNIEKIGVIAGHRLNIGSTTYVFIWPVLSILPIICMRILEIVKRKLEKYCRDYQHICREVDKLVEKALSNIKILKELSIDVKYPHKREIGIRKEEVRLHDLNYHDLRIPEKTHMDVVPSIADIFLEAYYHTGDTELLHLAKRAKDLLNSTSIAYYIEQNHDMTLIYLSDLQNGELSVCLRRTFSIIHNNRVLVEVAPHHGNAYSPYLNLINPTISYVSRCPYHVPRLWLVSRRFREYIRLRLRSDSSLIVSGHSNALTISL